MKITKDSEYYDDVHYGWYPVSPHWVGDDEYSHSHTIWIPNKKKKRTKKIVTLATADDNWNGFFDAAISQYDNGY